MLEFLLDRSCADLGQASQLLWGQVCSSQFILRIQCLTTVIPITQFLYFTPFSERFPEDLRGEYWYILIIFIMNLYINQYTLKKRRKFSGKSWEWHKYMGINKYLKGSLTTWPFSTIVGLVLLRAYALPSHRFLTRFMRISLVRQSESDWLLPQPRCYCCISGYVLPDRSIL